MKYIIRYKTQYAPITTEGAPFCADPIGIPDTVVLPSDIIEGTLQITMAGALDTPTSVTITYLPGSGDSTAWVPQPARQSLIGVNSGAVEDIPSVVELPGVRRLVEALRKANSRLTRLQFPGQYSWQTFDAGIKFQKGDVVRLPDFRGLNGQFVRILSIEMVDIGIYQISAEHYSPAMYADQIVPDGDSGIVPVGLILPYEGALPGGWEDYSAANGKYIIGAGGDTDIGAVAGDAMVPAIAGTTATSGAHTGSVQFPSYPSPSPAIPGINSTLSGNSSQGDHNHAVSVASFDPQIYRRHTKLMKKITSTALTLPPESLIFGRDEIFFAGIERVALHNSRLLYADATTLNAGIASLGVTLTTGLSSAPWIHTHGPGTQSYPNEAAAPYDNFVSIPPEHHTHGFSGSVLRNLRQRQLAAYGSGGQYVLRPGMIGMWDGDMEALPTDFYLCDGANGTIDMVDYFVAYAGETTAAPFGNNTVIVSGNTAQGGSHSHKYDEINRFSSQNMPPNWSHEDEVSHSHIVSLSTAYRPPGYALAFIMYLPPPNE